MPVRQSFRSALPDTNAGISLAIAIVNNMPDGALKRTELQFLEVLGAPSEQLRVDFFALPEIPRRDAARDHIKESYKDIAELWTRSFDGVIVTGATPRTPDFAGEPYWPTLTRLFDWAEENTISSIFSCLAAHAAVFYRHAIPRHPYRAKLSGVFECASVGDHALLEGLPRSWYVPHSRYNNLRQGELIEKGYTVLSASPQADVDMFLQPSKDLRVCLQGHPEYDRQALLLEYRRDVMAYLAGEAESYPEEPQGYFQSAGIALLHRFREQAQRYRSVDLMKHFPDVAIEHDIAAGWRQSGLKIYQNWLTYLRQQKACDSVQARTRPQGASD